jgi:hypothetical protein
MPKWAARIWLEITGVRVERVQDITPGDCEAEGIERGPCECPPDPPGYGHHSLCPNSDAFLLSEFRGLWDSLNAPRGYGWDANPWVWVYAFRVLSVQGRPDEQSSTGSGA